MWVRATLTFMNTVCYSQDASTDVTPLSSVATLPISEHAAKMTPKAHCSMRCVVYHAQIMVHCCLRHARSLPKSTLALHNVRVAVCQMKLSRSWLVQQHNDTKQ